MKGQGAIECCPGSTARPLPGQGAIESRAATAGALSGQGATEYLVLLAVVLIIALVGIALLGFFPGTATDSQISESQIYWGSASPIAIVETGSAYKSDASGEPYGTMSAFYFRIRNNGNYRITLSSMTAGGYSMTRFNACTDASCSGGSSPYLSTVSLSPGEEICFGHYSLPGSPCYERSVFFDNFGDNPGTPGRLEGAATICDSDGNGLLTLKDFGFTYTELVEGQTISKRFVGTKDLLIKCAGTCPGFATPC